MSDDPAGGVIPRIRELVRAADAFQRFLDLRAFTQHSKWEIDGGHALRDLVESLRTLERVEPSPQIRYGMNKLWDLLLTLTRRWGWDHVVGADGELFLAEQERLMDENERSWYGGIRSYVDAFFAEQITQPPSTAYRDIARRAERNGIPPTTPPVLTEEALDSLHKAWCLTPYLASDFPVLEDGEYSRIKDAITEIRDGTSDLCGNGDPAAGSDRSHSALQPALIAPSRRAEEASGVAPAGPPGPTDGRPSVPMVIPAKYLNDPEWLIEFKSLIHGYVNTALDIAENRFLPGYPLQMRTDDLGRNFGWLKQHIRRAAEDRSRPKPDEFTGVEAKLLRAFLWSSSLVEESKLDSRSFPAESELDAWRSILKLLDYFDFEASRVDGPPADPPNSGTAARPPGENSEPAGPPVGPADTAPVSPAGPLGHIMSDGPEVIRGPHGVSFTYSPTTLPASQEPEVFDPSKHPEWVARMEEMHREGLLMEEARRSDQMPDPDALTVGQMIDFITFLSRTPMEWLANPIIGQKYNRRDVVLLASPGWKAFLDWKDRARLHRRSRLEAAEELLNLVGERTGKLTREMRSTPLMEAVRLLDQPEAPAGPSADPLHRRDDGTDATNETGEKRGDRSNVLPAAADKGEQGSPGGESTQPTTRLRRPRRKPGHSAELIIAALDSFAADGKWKVCEADIIERAGVARSTYFDVVRQNEQVQEALRRFRSKGRGRGPARPRDL
jgi:hypothetical protein